MALAEAAIPEFTFGERLAKARKHAGLTQDGMAEKMGISASAIAQWETDRSQPRAMLDTVERWGTVTGVDQAWLLGFRTGSFSPPLQVITNDDLYMPMTLPFDRHLATV